MLKFSGFADLTSCPEKQAARPLAFAQGARGPHQHSTKHACVRCIHCMRWGNPTRFLHQAPRLPQSTRLDTHIQTADCTRATTQSSEASQRHDGEGDTESGVLSGVSQKRSLRSNPCWLTEFCKSQCLSHFAAPFIVVRTKTSVAESCKEA
jgi:hypothetical protein